jgi:hypothetical protein
MDNGQWTMDNGQWTMGNGQMDNGQWMMEQSMDKWSMENRQKTKGFKEFEGFKAGSGRVYVLCSGS